MKDSDAGLLFISVTVFLWSTIEVISKLIQEEIPPLTIAFLRFFIGGLFLFPLVIKYGRKLDFNRIGMIDVVKLVLLSVIGITTTFLLFHKALTWIDASSVATLVSMVPIFAVPISVLFLKEKMGPLGFIGFIMGGVGIMILYLSEKGGENSLLGVLLMVLAVLGFSVYSVFMKPLNRKTDPRVTTPLSLLLGSFFMIPFLLLEGDPLFVADTSPGSWMGILYIGVFTVGLAYLFFFMGIDRMKVSRGASLMYMKPALAAILAVGILSEIITPFRILSILIITISVYFTIREEKIMTRIRQFGYRRSGN
jgi:drug/metabolite transporter (DMT)-like permease